MIAILTQYTHRWLVAGLKLTEPLIEFRSFFQGNAVDGQ